MPEPPAPFTVDTEIRAGAASQVVRRARSASRDERDRFEVAVEDLDLVVGGAAGRTVEGEVGALADADIVAVAAYYHGDVVRPGHDSPDHIA